MTSVLTTCRALRAHIPHTPRVYTSALSCNLDILCQQPLPPHACSHAHEQKAQSHALMHSASGHGRWVWLQWPTKTQYFVMLVGRATKFWAYWSHGSFLPNLTYYSESLCLQVAQMPRCWNQTILVSTMVTITTIELITIPLVHSCGVIIMC